MSPCEASCARLCRQLLDNKGTGPHANRCLHLRTSGVLCIGSFQSQNSAKECPGANSDLDLGGDPQDTIHHLNRNMSRYYRECIQVNGGHRLLLSHLLTYSGANSYYIPCWICKFVYLQRNELCIILKERKINSKLTNSAGFPTIISPNCKLRLTFVTLTVWCDFDQIYNPEFINNKRQAWGWDWSQLYNTTEGGIYRVLNFYKKKK